MSNPIAQILLFIICLIVLSMLRTLYKMMRGWHHARIQARLADFFAEISDGVGGCSECGELCFVTDEQHCWQQLAPEQREAEGWVVLASEVEG